MSDVIERVREALQGIVDDESVPFAERRTARRGVAMCDELVPPAAAVVVTPPKDGE